MASDGTGPVRGREGRTYYNEHDPYAAQWIRNLIAGGLVSPGDVDERDIRDVRPGDLDGYTRCHFFAGIAGWDYALDLAGWGTAPVWTGSCPCQPFSTAGRRGGFDDARHLWPVWFDLIRECRPATVFGEQVEAAVRLGWLDAVFADLEGAGYACGAAVLGAHSVGAPHIRQRLWFVADAGRERCDGEPVRLWQPGPCGRIEVDRAEAAGSGEAGRSLADSSSERRHGRELAGAAGATSARGPEADEWRPAGLREPAGCVATGVMGDAEGRQQRGLREPDQSIRWELSLRGSGAWGDVTWLSCRDGKARPTQPGLQPLAHGVPARVGRLRAYGNAIVPEVAAAFIAAASPSPSPASPGSAGRRG